VNAAKPTDYCLTKARKIPCRHGNAVAAIRSLSGDVREAEQVIEYLNSQLELKPLSELRETFCGNQLVITSGDKAVVPLETDRIRPLTLWANVTQKLNQCAMAIAAIRTFDN